MSECPYCQATTPQIKVGKNASGSQRYQSRACQRRYPPEPKGKGDGDEMRQQAVKRYTEGVRFRRIARHVGVAPGTGMDWGKAHTDPLADAPLPAEKPLHIVEMDELSTFVGKKKTRSRS